MKYQRENQEDYESLLMMHELVNEVAGVGNWSWFLEDNRLSWSKITREIYEVTPDYIPILEKVIDFYQKGDDCDQLRNALSEAKDPGTSFDLESIIITAKGREIWIRTTGRCEEKNGIVIRIYGTVQDITEKKFADKEIRRKENMLKAIAISSESLLSDTDIFPAIANCLVVIGQAVDADRVYLFQNSLTPENKLIASQKVEWNSGIADPQIDNPELQNVPIEIFDSFLANLYQRIPFNTIVDQLSPDLAIREILISQNIKSILIFPIFCRNQFWGFVGFDECKYNRQWAEDDISILQSFCNSISSAIERTIATKELYDLSLFPQENPDPLFRIDLQGNILLRNNTAESISHFKYQDKNYPFADFAAIRHVAHHIKPNLANFGLNDLKEDIHTIEILAEKELATAELENRIQRLDEVINKVIKQLANEKYKY